MIGELLEVYIEDLRDNLLLLDDGLMALRNGAQDEGILDNIFRVAHTIKGNSASMDFMRVERVMHAMEDILQEVRNGSYVLSDAMIDLLYTCHDFLEDCLVVVARDHSDAGLVIDDILAELTRARGISPASDAAGSFTAADQTDREKELLGIIATNCRLGYDAYEIVVTFTPDCQMKSVRAWFVYEQIDNYALLIFAHPERPSAEMFGSPEYCFTASMIHMIVLSPQGIDDLVNALTELEDIEGVTAREIASLEEVYLLLRRFRIEEELLALVKDMEEAVPLAALDPTQMPGLISSLESLASRAAQENLLVVENTANAAALALQEASEEKQCLADTELDVLASLIQLLEEYIRAPEISAETMAVQRANVYLDNLRPAFFPVLGQNPAADKVKAFPRIPETIRRVTDVDTGSTCKPNPPQGKIPAGQKKPMGYRSDGSTAKSDSGVVRVPVGKVDSLLDMLGELLILNSQLEQYVGEALTGDSHTLNILSRTAKLIKTIQSLSMSLRMVEIRPTLHRLTRIARDTAIGLGKRVSVVLEGEETEIDRSAAEKLFDPLMHLVRNAVSHGIEEEGQRLAAGKHPEGQIHIRCYHQRGSVYIEVSDDGRGMSPERILAKARALHMAEESREYTEEEILRFIFRPGFSTQEEINNISGRGVGMNVVEEEVRRAGGRVDIINHPGQGCTFVLRIPINLAVLNGTVVEVAGGRYIIPTLFIKEFYVAEKNNWISMQGGKNAIRLRDKVIPILWPHRLFGIDSRDQDQVRREVVVLEMEHRLLAFPVDRIVSRQEIVSKPLIDHFDAIQFASQASILGDGCVSLILDVEAMFGLADQKLVSH